MATVCQTVCFIEFTYWPQLGQLEMVVEHFEDVTPGRAGHRDVESHALLDHAYLVRLATDLAKLRGHQQRAQLRHCEQRGVSFDQSNDCIIFVCCNMPRVDLENGEKGRRSVSYAPIRKSPSAL